jgi:hypothetical protein
MFVVAWAISPGNVPPRSKESKITISAMEKKPNRTFETFAVPRRETPVPDQTRVWESTQAFGKWQRIVKGDSSSRLSTSGNAVAGPMVSITAVHGTPSISVYIEGKIRDLIIDTGSSISILQPGVSNNGVNTTAMRGT